MHFLKGKRTNIFIDDYCRPAKVFSWHFSMICSFYTFMEKGVGFFIPVYPLVFHHKKSLILTFYCFCQDGILRFHHKSQSGLMEGANFYVQARRFLFRTLASLNCCSLWVGYIGQFVFLVCRFLFQNIKFAHYLKFLH